MGARGPKPTGAALTPAERQHRHRAKRAREQAVSDAHMDIKGFPRAVLRELASQRQETEAQAAAALLKEVLPLLASPERVSDRQLADNIRTLLKGFRLKPRDVTDILNH